MTDSAGAIAETLDYFPFGAIRIDKSAAPAGAAGTVAFSEQRKYIGQEFDPDTGLNYLNARYYNSAIARFTSIDPMFWNFDKGWLTDPQNQNAYSYGRNNPLIYADSNGKRAELVVVPITGVPGAHGYINIIPEQGENLSQYNINGGNGSHYTIGGYPGGVAEGLTSPTFGNLQVIINESGNYNNPDSKFLAKYNLSVPNGMTIGQYDKKLLESATALSHQDLGPYDPLGRPITISANSGNVATQVVINSGGIFPQTQNFYKDSNGRSYFAPGLGTPVNSLQFALSYATTAIDFTQQRISQLSSTISQTSINSVSATVSRISSLIDSLVK